MKPPSPKNIELARRKINQAARLIDEVCSLTGADPHTITFRRVKIDQRPAAVTESSHTPARRPEAPLPRPAPGQRATGSELLHSSVSLELERRTMAAGCFRAVTKIVHHPECAFETTSGRASSCICLDCDCSPMFLARLNGQTFAITPDGTLERFTEPPPSPEKFRTDDRAFFVDAAWDVQDWVLPLIADHLEFTISGDGVTEHFIELPHASDIETRTVPDP